MTIGSRSASRSILSLALVLALSLPALAPAAAAAVADDEIPGVPLTDSPVSGALSDADDADDVYSIALNAGDTLTATLTDAGPGTDFDLLLYGPDAASVIGTSSPVAEGPRQTYPDTLTYTARVAGTYYLDVQAFLGSGDYTLEWQRSAGPAPLPGDDNISAELPELSPEVIGSLDDVTDPDDVFRLYLSAGDVLSLTVGWTDLAVGSTFEARLYGPNATDITQDATIAVSQLDTSSESTRAALTYIAPEDGYYYLDVYALLGAGPYTLVHRIEPAELDTDNDISQAESLTASPVTGTLNPVVDVRDYYSVVVDEGQSLDVTLTAPADFVARLYAPGASPDDTPAVSLSGAGTFTHAATVAGRYLLEVTTGGSAGAYTLDWSLREPVSSAVPRLEASLPSRVSWGKGVTLTATLTADGAPLAGQVLSIQARAVGAASFSEYATRTTDAAGVATATVFPAKPTEYRVVYGLGEEQTSSPVLTCMPTAGITMPSVRKTTYRPGETFSAAGYLKPRHRAGGRDVRVYAQRYERQSNGTYKWVSRRMVYARLVNYGSYSKYSCSISLPSRGKWRLRAYVIGNSVHVSTWSAARYLTAK